MSVAPVVKLYRNPWREILLDGVVLQILQTAAIEADEKLQKMIARGEVEDGRDSFGAVLLDPTRPRWANTFEDRLFASIELGPNGTKYLPNGAAKADAHDRHGVPNGVLVMNASHCLSDGDFAWGDSAEYNFAIGGGSGLSVEQDGEMVEMILEAVMDAVRDRRDAWLEEQRRAGSHGWYNPDDMPGAEYVSILAMDAIMMC